MFAPLSTLTPETLMNVLGLIFKGEAIKHSVWCISTSRLVPPKELLMEGKLDTLKFLLCVLLIARVYAVNFFW